MHSQHAAGGAAAVAARVDSLEHGMELDPALLPRMAEQGTALTPTLGVLLAHLDDVRYPPGRPPQGVVPARRDRPPGPGRRGRRGGMTMHLARHRLPPARPGRRRDPRAGRGRPDPAPGARRRLLDRPRLPGPRRPHPRCPRQHRRLRRRPPHRPDHPGPPPRGHPPRPPGATLAVHHVPVPAGRPLGLLSPVAEITSIVPWLPVRQWTRRQSSGRLSGRPRPPPLLSRDA